MSAASSDADPAPIRNDRRETRLSSTARRSMRASEAPGPRGWFGSISAGTSLPYPRFGGDEKPDHTAVPKLSVEAPLARRWRAAGARLAPLARGWRCCRLRGFRLAADLAAADFHADLVIGRQEFRACHVSGIIEKAEHRVARGEEFVVGEPVQLPGS